MLEILVPTILLLCLVTQTLRPVTANHRRHHLVHLNRNARISLSMKALVLLTTTTTTTTTTITTTATTTTKPNTFHSSDVYSEFKSNLSLSTFTVSSEMCVWCETTSASKLLSTNIVKVNNEPTTSQTRWQSKSSLVYFIPSSPRSNTVSITAAPVQPTNDTDNSTTVILQENFALEAASNSKDAYPDLTQIRAVQLVFLLCYLVVMVSSLLGNLLVCYTVLSNRKMQTVVNCYIVNLALCDFLIGAFVLPSKLLELLAPAEWFFLFLVNGSLCTVIWFLQTVIVFASVLTLVATCFERYFAIVHPLESRMQQSKRRTCRILIAVWFLSCMSAVPNFNGRPQAVIDEFTSDLGTIRRMTCVVEFEPRFRMVYFTILFVAFYLIPLLLIAFTSFCIARSLLRTSVLRRQGSLLRQEVNRRKVGKMILIVVLSFLISWTPYFIVTIVTQYQEENFFKRHDYFFTMLSINLFAFLHSSINPLIYATMSTRFRNGFIHILRLLLCCKQITGNLNGQTSFNDPASSSRGSLVNGMISHTKRCSQSQ